MNQKTKTNLIIDVGNTNIKFGFVVNNNLVIKKLNIKCLNSSQIEQVIEQYELNEVFIGSVNKNILNEIMVFFNSKKIKVIEIDKQWFKPYINLNPKIDFNEIGIDILAFCYYFSPSNNCLIVNFGTATVIVKYINNTIDSVMIGANLFNINKDINALLNVNQKDFFNHSIKNQYFACDTFNCIKNFNLCLINGLFDELFAVNSDIKQLFISGNDMNNFKNIYENNMKITYKMAEEATINGYFQLLMKINKIFSK